MNKASIKNRVTIVDLPHLMVETTKDAAESFYKEYPKKMLAFTKKDYEFFTSKGGPAKANERISRFRDNIKFHVMLHPGERQWQPRCLEAMEASIAENRSERLNVVFSTNVTSPDWWMPMTAWIMAHRISHIVQLYHQGLEESLVTNVHNLLDEWFYDPHKRYGSWIGFGDNHNMTEFLSSVMTMRSARERRVPSIDIFGELIAQYQHGGVRLHRSNTWATQREDQRRRGVIPPQIKGDMDYKMEHLWGHWDETAPAMEEMLNREIGAIMEKLRDSPSKSF